MWVLLGLVVIGGGIYLAHKKGFIKFGKGDLNAPDLSNANVSGDISNLNTPSLENPIQVNNIPQPNINTQVNTGVNNPVV